MKKSMQYWSSLLIAQLPLLYKELQQAIDANVCRVSVQTQENTETFQIQAEQTMDTDFVRHGNTKSALNCLFSVNRGHHVFEFHLPIILLKKLTTLSDDDIQLTCLKINSVYMRQRIEKVDSLPWNLLKIQMALQRVISNWLFTVAKMGLLKRFITRMKEELVASVWHPRRVERWLEAGVALEDM